MIDVILISALLIGCGIGWRWLTPQGLDADTLRRSLTGLVYHLLLPALVLGVLWRAPLGLESVAIVVVAATMVLLGLGLAWGWLLLFPQPRPIAGALLLAAAFPNATYLGLPVLEAVIGEQGRALAIQYDLLACTPLLLTLGITIAARFGASNERPRVLSQLLRVPPLWAAMAGVLLNIADLSQPQWIEKLLTLLGNGVVPLMLIALGLSLQWRSGWGEQIRQVIPVVMIRLLLIPLLATLSISIFDVQAATRLGVILEAAMPSMVLGIVLADRFALDSHIYAMTVTLSTALSLITLPLWHQILT